MIVPKYWAEARLQQGNSGITVRRFGWSDVSPQEARTNAEARASEALTRIASGEKLMKREPKRAYNGANGVPIREEIISEHGDTIITRNSYGARCLNTPNVLFADIDFPSGPDFRQMMQVFQALAICAGVAGIVTHSIRLALCISFAGLLLCAPVAGIIFTLRQKAQGGTYTLARKTVDKFLAKHPEWKLRLYKTPAGLRVLVTHRTFLPDEPLVSEFFAALNTDPMYVRMCKNQQCFRARVSAKPWRIGMKRLKVYGVWPVAPERMQVRAQWVLEYESGASAYAACSFTESLGAGHTHPDVMEIQELHDTLSQSTRRLPIA